MRIVPRLARYFLVGLLPIGSLAGCSSSKGASDAGREVDARADASVPSHDAGATPDAAERGDAAAVKPDGSVLDAPMGSDGGGYFPSLDASAITGLTDDTWTWVDIPGALCRDGSPTGIGINPHANATGLVIYLEGGGECMNAESCQPDGGTPSSYSAADFTTKFADPSKAGTIFDRTLATSAVAAWSYVFVPYCTGDLHGGNNPGGHPADVAMPQQYVGYVDMQLILARLPLTFPSVTKVLLTGGSAGGAGAGLNYLQTAERFSAATVDLLDDSAPPMTNTYLAPCLQAYWATLYRYDRTVLATCGAACAGGNVSTIGLQQLAVEKYPDSTFGVLDSMNDGVIKALYGYGNYDCAGLLADAGAQLTADAGPVLITDTTFPEGQLAIRDAMAPYTNFGTFLFPGSQHTTLARATTSGDNGQTYGSRTAGDGGTTLISWVANLVNGSVHNVGP